MRITMLAAHDLRRDLRPTRAAAALVRAGHRVTVHGVLADGAEPEEDTAGVVLVRTAAPRASGPWLRRFEPLAQAAAARGRPDVVHAVGLDVLAPAAAAARAAGVPLVLDRPGAHAAERELASSALRHTGLRGLVRRIRLRSRTRSVRRLEARVRRDGLAAVVAGSAVLAARIADEHAGPPPVVVRDCLPWTEPPARTQALRVRAGVDPARRLLVYRGGGGPGSGLDAAVRALRVLGEHVVLVLLGWPLSADGTDGSAGGRRELQRLEEIAADYGVGAQLRALPPAPADETRGLLRSADAALLPGAALAGTRTPGALFEYLAAGVPIVASDARGPDGRSACDVGDIVRETGAGVLFAARAEPDPGAIAEAVHTLLSDAALSAACRESAVRAAAGELSWESESRRLVTLYERLESLFAGDGEGNLGSTRRETP